MPPRGVVVPVARDRGGILGADPLPEPLTGRQRGEGGEPVDHIGEGDRNVGSQEQRPENVR